MRRTRGRGLSQLLAEQVDEGTREIAVEDIRANPTQPRVAFDEESLKELADSIRQVGILSPLLIRPVGDGQYEIIAGERRWRAAQLAGLDTIPAVIRSANAQNTLEMAIIENVQRVDIGSLEAADAYHRLIQEFGLTQEEVAQKVGKSRSAIANLLRLLKLTDEVRQALANGRISEGHGRALLLAKTDAQQLEWLERVLVENLNVRQTEALANPQERKATTTSPAVRADSPLQSALRQHFAAPVKIESGEKKGRITIEFYGEEDLSRIFDILGVQVP